MRWVTHKQRETRNAFPLSTGRSHRRGHGGPPSVSAVTSLSRSAPATLASVLFHRHPEFSRTPSPLLSVLACSPHRHSLTGLTRPHLLHISLQKAQVFSKYPPDETMTLVAMRVLSASLTPESPYINCIARGDGDLPQYQTDLHLGGTAYRWERYRECLGPSETLSSLKTDKTKRRKKKRSSARS